MEIRGIVTTTVLILALITIATTTAAALSCDCDICVNTTGWWNDGGAFNASGAPIQAAVNNASGGDTICVAVGSYTENVDIATAHLTLAGAGADVVTVTAASLGDHVFYVTADYVNISGFNATGATSYLGAGIYLNGADHCNISENTASGNWDGIFLYHLSDNTLVSNNASNNSNGIGLDGSCNYNTLTSNNANSNDGVGIGLFFSCNYNTLAGNNASNNDYGGILLLSSSNNTLESNNVNSKNVLGIVLSGSSNNTLASNTASYNEYGIGLGGSSNNTLIGNTANSNAEVGIALDSSSDNTLVSNNASNNTQCDICIGSSDSTFTDNTLNGTTISFAYSGDISLKGVGSPAADPTGQQTIGKFINATNQSTGAWLFLNFSYSEADVSGLDESNLVVWKHNGTVWLEDGWNGTRYLDTAGNVVGVNITSFSVFAPAAPDPTYIPPDPTNLANTTGGGYFDYWVNYTWSAGIGNVTDS